MALLLEKRWRLATLMAIVGAIVVLALVLSSGTSSREAEFPAAAGPTGSHATLVHGDPARDFARDVPEPLAPNSYRELATTATERGEEVRLFTGALKETSPSLGTAGTSCFGLRTARVVGLACGVDSSGNRALRVSETTYRGYKMVAGLVSSEVEELYLTWPGGRSVQIPIRDGTFFFSGHRIGVIEAYGDGEVLERYELAP